jgi:hypothetical protein
LADNSSTPGLGDYYQSNLESANRTSPGIQNIVMFSDQSAFKIENSKACKKLKALVQKVKKHGDLVAPWTSYHYHFKSVQIWP